MDEVSDWIKIAGCILCRPTISQKTSKRIVSNVFFSSNLTKQILFILQILPKYIFIMVIEYGNLSMANV